MSWSRSSRLGPVVLMLLVAPPVAQQAQTARGTGLILGRVVDAATGQPVPAATVLLSARNASTRETALTGADGQFVFMDLPAAGYGISAIKTGYLDGAYGRARPGGTTAEFTLAAGQRAGDVRIQMWRPASIGGHITDEDGRPMAGVRVTATRGQPLSTRHDSFGGSALTDERGDYRIARLNPGSYSLSVLCRSMTVPIPASVGPVAPNAVSGTSVVDATGRFLSTGDGPRSPAASSGAKPAVYLTSYYPGTSRPTGATTISVVAGQELDGMDFPIVSRPGVRLAGTLTGPNGPVALAMVRLFSPDTDPISGDSFEGPSPLVTAVTADDGSFVFLNAPAGDYLLDAYRPQPPIGRVTGISPTGLPQLEVHDYSSGDAEGWTARMPISIAGEMRDVAVTMTPRSRAGVTVTGSVMVEPPMVFTNGRSIDPFFISLDSDRDRGGMSDRVRADGPGPFAIESVPPGRYELRAGSLLVGFSIVSATISGQDVLGAPLEVGPGGVANLVVRISNRLNGVTGTVADASGRPVRDAGIALFTVDAKGWAMVASTSPRLHYVRAGSETFTIEGFPDGNYYLLAVDDALMADWPDPALLRQMAARAVRLDVRGGAKKTQNLTMVRTLR